MSSMITSLQLTPQWSLGYEGEGSKVGVASVVATSVCFHCFAYEGYFTYTLTERRVINGERVDQLRQIKSREYKVYL